MLKSEREEGERRPVEAYIQSGALMTCNKGSVPCRLVALPKTVFYNGNISCTEADNKAAPNGFNFGYCSAARKACTSCISLTKWTKVKEDFKIEGNYPLVISSELPCATGGKIKFAASGQE